MSYTIRRTRLSNFYLMDWLSSIFLPECPCPLCISTWFVTPNTRRHLPSPNIPHGYVHLGNPEQDTRPPEQVVLEAVQMLLEEAYPNVLSVDDLVRILKVDDRALLELQLSALEARDVVQLVPLEGRTIDQRGFRRKIHLQNQEVTEVKGADHMQRVSTSEKPTIAIITNLLCEKLAVDAMIEQKTTFVRYKTEGGESNVYTLGNIGPHRVISTKLPMVGGELQAKISSSNITTRLLGAFQSVQHVFLVGVGGGVPHVCEFEKHSRLGDVVVSAPATATSPITNGDHKGDMLKLSVPDNSTYIYCSQVIDMDNENGTSLPHKFILQSYKMDDLTLLACVNRVLDRFESDPNDCEWFKVLQASLNTIGEGDSVDFSRPRPDTDKLKLKIDEGVTFDIKHPEVPDDLRRLYPSGVPAVRLGRFGSGRPITDNDQLRDFFAKEYQLLSYDSEYDQVLEAALGSGVKSFLVIRGIADYVEGRQGTQWQPYASLAAASFMKSVILELAP